MACRVCKSEEVPVGVCPSCLKSIVQTSNQQKHAVTKSYKRYSYAREYRSYFFIAAAAIGILAVPLSYLSEYKLTLLQRLVLGFDITFLSLLTVGWMMIPVLVGMESLPNMVAIVAGGGLPILFNPSPWMLLSSPMWMLGIARILGEGEEIKEMILIFTVAYAGVVLGLFATSVVMEDMWRVLMHPELLQ